MLEITKDYTLQIILATYPHSNRTNYKDSIKKNFIEKYKTDFNKLVKSEKNFIPSEFYNAAVFHMFGNYDVAFVSLIDSFKYTQKLLIPENNPNTYQVLTGIHLSTSLENRNLEIKTIHESNYIDVSHLKLNIGYLIGNGQEIIRNIKEKIDVIFSASEKIDYSLLLSFTWSELIIIIYGENLENIIHKVTEIRNIKVESLDLDQISNSLNVSQFENSEKYEISQLKEKWKNSHLISDTHSFIGVNFENFEKIDNSLLKIPVEIEWQIKPSHQGNLIDKLRDLELGNFKFVSGKSDFITRDNGLTLKNSQKIFTKLKNGDSKIFEIVRKIKTKLIFSKFENHPSSDNQLPVRFIKKFIVTETEFKQLNEALKKTKITRNLREKLLKIFYNYNNGINDPILFSLFLDMTLFVENLKKVILENGFKIDKLIEVTYVEDATKPLSVMQTEERYRKRIYVFEEGHQIRIMNSYVYEEASDFDLDLNSSVEQLLSCYSTVLFELSKAILGEYESYNPIVSFNLKNTVGNYYSVNFGLHELTSPEFIFFTVAKEIFNVAEELQNHEYSEKKDKNISKEIYLKIRGEFELSFIEYKDYTSENYKKIIFELFKIQNLVDFDYLLSDSIRFVMILNQDFKLFEYWFWTYNLQNTSLYGVIGVMDEDHFKKELFRLLLIRDLFKVKDPDDLSKNYELKCPIPSLSHFWLRWSKIFDGILFDTLENRSVVNDEILKYLRHYSFERNHNKLIKALVFDISPNLVNPEFNFENSFELYNSYNLENDRKLFNILLNENESIRSFNIVEDSVIYLQKFIYSYLKRLMKLNLSKIELLIRNQNDGRPTDSFINKDEEKNIFVDQLGGNFFNNFNNSKEYFNLRNQAILCLWDFSYKVKKNFIKHIIGKK